MRFARPHAQDGGGGETTFGRATYQGMPFHGPGYLLREGAAGRLALMCQNDKSSGRPHWTVVIEVLQDEDGEDNEQSERCEVAFTVKAVLQGMLHSEEEELEYDEEPETDDIYVCVNEDM